ncbi:hypothetical protein [Magnetospira sp. QH-2]|uniref:hypothetical protein n=1 Tax=Magnetospira sp. (strain QH-2) TaxID=1288970 RepID=UPI0003E81018|nr:hypothetical protein [Magnetospira sp. QH-2]CCQ73150.1 Membrane protein of unknown function [Magnetospira sp. QH-2]
MNEFDSPDHRGWIIRGLTLGALLMLVGIYYSPTWWVALTAPNYPAEAFPDGVRINFHMNGVFNGCQKLDIAEKFEDEALDCVHEMDAINHFVGMYPIASGGVVEKAFAPFLLSLLGVMLAGFLVFNAKIRMLVMSVGFGAVAVWMAMTYHGEGGLSYQSSAYLQAMVTSLGQGHEEEGEELSPIIAKLKESLQESGESSLLSRDQVKATLERSGQTALIDTLAKLHSGSGESTAEAKSLKAILAEARESGVAGKELNIHILKGAFEADQARKPSAVREAWVGSGKQLLFWHYEKALGRWFNNPEEIRPLVATMTIAGTVVFYGVLAAMVFFVYAGRKNGGFFFWLLVLIPIGLPMFFIIEYSSWLWWYGHSLNDMGAFTLKPFMPTVFGQGKVAQFATHSYPALGFGLMVLSSLFLALAALLRRQQLRDEDV